MNQQATNPTMNTDNCDELSNAWNPLIKKEENYLAK